MVGREMVETRIGSAGVMEFLRAVSGGEGDSGTQVCLAFAPSRVLFLCFAFASALARLCFALRL